MAGPGHDLRKQLIVAHPSERGLGKAPIACYDRRSMKTIDVLGLGCTAVDDLLYVPQYPAEDTKMRVRRRERQCGGLCATALVAAARLGATALRGRAGG